MEVNEQQLIRRCLRQEPAAQQELYRRYVQAMYNTVIRMVGNAMDAEDIIQETFVSVFQHLPEFKGDATVGAWIKRIAVNTALNFLRKNRRITFLNREPDEELAGVAEAGEEESPPVTMKTIHHAIKRLPEGCRVVLSLFLLEGYQHQEIAQILDISVSTSKTQYQRARRLLQQELKGNLVKK